MAKAKAKVVAAKQNNEKSLITLLLGLAVIAISMMVLMAGW